jgi:hypothetical protein
MSSNLALGLSILKKNTSQTQEHQQEENETLQNSQITSITEYLKLNNIDNKTLDNKFTVWFHDANEPEFTMDKFFNITNFETVSEYIMTTQVLRDNYKMLLNGMFFIMKNNINPVWTDDANRDGGCISWKIEKYNSLEYWENLLMLFVTNNLPVELNKYNINGISINPKKNCNIIKLWLASDIEGDILNKIDLTDKCLFKDKLKLYKSFKKFI